MVEVTPEIAKARQQIARELKAVKSDNIDVVVDEWQLQLFAVEHQRKTKDPKSYNANAARLGTGFLLHDETKLKSRIQVVKDPHVLRVDDNESIAFCVTLPGRTTEQTLDHDSSADSAQLMTNVDGYTLRSANQLLPLVSFRRNGMEKVYEIREIVVAKMEKILAKLPQIDAATVDNSSHPPPDPKQVQPWDVMCDRYDPRCAEHFGNRRFAIIVCMFMTKDQDLFDVSVRIRVARAIIHTIHNGEPGGRFLAKTRRSTWKEIDDTLAIKWISLILKTAAAQAAKANESNKNPKDPEVIADSVKFSMKTDEIPKGMPPPETWPSPETVAVE
mmetsp:Transcript_16742/g.28386  ORF Transcript_16742/g.28386 Transcript_16742/m.28386 type:complete len:331 (-) Transcript_16742:597-1589(-)